MNAQSTAVAVAEPRPAKVPLVSGNSPRAIVPTDFDGAWRIGNAVCEAGMAPRGLETPAKCTIAILHGLEVGLPPMAALQSISVINGRPSLWGDGALGLVQASGLLDDQDEHFEGTPGTDGYKAVCILKRKGKSKSAVGEFSIAQAKTSGLWTKRGRNGEPTPWQTYPERMLKMRARGFALRDGFSDILKGLGIAEEQEDIVRHTQAETKVDDGGGPPNPANDDGGGPPVPTEETTLTEVVTETVTETVTNDDGGGPPVPAEEGDGLDIPDYLRRSPDKPLITEDEQKWLDGLEAAFADCRDAATLFEQNAELMQPEESSVGTEAWNAACAILEKHIERLQS